MHSSDTDVVIYVTYTGTPESRFDRDYYTGKHMPLVMAAWQQYGLKSAAVFYPALTGDGTVAICECRFADEAALEAAFASPEAAGVMADVVRFTDLVPARVRAAAL